MIFLKYVPSFIATLFPYCKKVYIFDKNGGQKERKIKRGNLYSVGLYQRGVVLLGVRGRSPLLNDNVEAENLMLRRRQRSVGEKASPS